MKFSTTEQEPRETVIKVELAYEDVEPYLAQAYSRVVQRLNIPGFRKGKAPRQIVEQRYGREYLINEALDQMVPDVTNKLVQQESLEAASAPSITLDQLDPVSFTATVPLVPSVDLSDYLELRVDRRPVNVPAGEVDDVLKQLNFDMAPWEPMEDDVHLEDLLNVSVRGWVDDESDDPQHVSENDHVDYIPKAESTSPVPGFAEALVGLVPDETHDLTISVPDTYPGSELAGKNVKFAVTVHSIKRKKLASIDDEFAKGVGDGFATVKALRTKIRADITEREEKQSSDQHRDETLSKIVAGARISMSPIIIDHELEHLLEEHQEAARTGRMNMEQYQQYIAWAGKTSDQIREELRPVAEDRLRRAFVLREVAKVQSIEVVDSELDEEIDKILDSAGEQVDNVRAMFEVPDQKESLRRAVLNRKILDRLTDIVLGNSSLSSAKRSPRTTKSPVAKRRTSKVTGTDEKDSTSRRTNRAGGSRS